MTLQLLLLVGVAGSAGCAWAISRGGRIARAGALGGILALAVMAILGGASGTPDAAAVTSGSATAWNGALAPNGYLRFVIVLAAIDGLILAAVAWLLGGLVGLRGLLPAAIAVMTGTTVALAAADPVVGALGAAGAGLAALPALFATDRASTAAREIRVSIAASVVLVAVAAVAPVVDRLVQANPGGAVLAGSAPAAAIGIALLATAVAMAGRSGVIPFHVRIAALTDAAPPAVLPVLLAWIPLPFAVVALTTVDGPLAGLGRLGLALGPERGIIVGITLLTLAAAALAAYIADDLRHAVGYLVLADAGIAILGVAVLDPAAWGPARVWLVVVAASKTALAAWAAVVEDRFETRSIPDLRGWAGPAPILAAALVCIIAATFGLPGWAAFEARGTLAKLAADGPWNLLLVVAGFLTLPTYFRILALGFGPPTSHVERAVPERVRAGSLPALPSFPRRRARSGGLDVEQEGPAPEPAPEPGTEPAATGRRPRPAAIDAPATPGVAVAAAADPRVAVATIDPRVAEARARRARRDATGSAGSWLAEAISSALRRNRTELLSAAVLALALLGSLVAWGALDVGHAAAELVPAIAAAAAD